MDVKDNQIEFIFVKLNESKVTNKQATQEEKGVNRGKGIADNHKTWTPHSLSELALWKGF